jgi:hypothetical protein
LRSQHPGSGGGAYLDAKDLGGLRQEQSPDHGSGPPAGTGARLTAPQIDEDLRHEIRDLVIARNHRRARTGKPPLDVEVEVERQIASLSRL